MVERSIHKIKNKLIIFNKFESFRFAKGRHVIVFTILITRKSVKMDGVNVIDTIRQFLRNFLWFLLLCIELTAFFHEFYENLQVQRLNVQSKRKTILWIWNGSLNARPWILVTALENIRMISAYIKIFLNFWDLKL